MLPERWITVDPGEDCGWACWSGKEFLDHGTDKMWDFADAVMHEAMRQLYGGFPPGPPAHEHLTFALANVEMIVVENWQLYPWKLQDHSLDWDECRTARLIGSIYEACRLTGWAYEQQPAKIKERAVAAGAETLFSHPLRENRHANDATMHGVFRIAVEEKAAWADLTETSWIVDA